MLSFALLVMAVTMRGADDDVKATMRQATQYMMDVVSCNGGFVWSYLPDFSRQWGELEARRTMAWMQAPGTPEMGELLLDAYHATGDEYYYESARRVALCIIEAQLPCGGWNYVYDTQGEDSLRSWYETIGRQAWRLEEFQHYYGNATFDDEATKHCAEFLLRIYLEKKEQAFWAPLLKTIVFFVESQYDNGGWPQRYPLMDSHPFRGKADYTPFITLNDDVMEANIDFLMQCYALLDMPQLKEPILKAMRLSRDLQQPLPLAGWADQYTPDDLKPAHARSYESRAINTSTTAAMVLKMIQYYQLTGDDSFLKGIPEAIDFLEKQQLPRTLSQELRRMPLQEDEILLPRFIDPDTGRPLYVHRRGSNVANGEYYTDEVAEGTIMHYSSFFVVSPARLREALDNARKWQRKDLQRNSPFNFCGKGLPKDYYFDAYRMAYNRMGRPTAQNVMATLNDKGYWAAPIGQRSNPYLPLLKNVEQQNDNMYAMSMTGDVYDTSPFNDRTTMGISTRVFIRNMSVLIDSLRHRTPTASGLYPDRFVSLVEGKPTQLCVIRNGKMEACVTNYGARLVSLMVPDKAGNIEDMVLGFDNIDDYHMMKNNFGSVVGRYSGRIKGATFTLDGNTYQLQQSGGGNISHGGYPGLSDRVWEVETVADSTLTMHYLSPDGENGFPGNLMVKVTYTLTYDNALRIDYKATTDKPTVINLTNHSFFNISGDPSTDVLSQQLFVDSKYIATYDKNKNLDGQFMKVKNTPFDFTTKKSIGADINIYDEQMAITKGYDHSYVLKHNGKILKPAAVIFDDRSERQMTVYTTQPALHVYTANGLDGSMVGKKGMAYKKNSAVCFETMHFGDSPNHDEFPSTVLRPGETFTSQTIFSFSEHSHKKRNLQSSILLYGGAASLIGLGAVGVMSLIH